MKSAIYKYIHLLQEMISLPSFSREEERVANLIRDFLNSEKIPFHTKDNNTWIKNCYWSEGKPVLFLDSHIDTVNPSAGWTRDPFKADIEGDRLYGLGSNDAGASVITLMAVFMELYQRNDLPFNLIYAASAEEEISGPKGMRNLLPELGSIDLAIIGEPTQMQMAIAEKGLMVLDCTARGKSGHAAREEGENALYKAIDDINKLRTFDFPKISQALGRVKMSVTQINAGVQHNVVPDNCAFVVDVRTNEHYSNQEAFEIIKQQISSEVTARSFHLNSSGIPNDHPLVKRGKELGLNCFGSPTTSDQAVIPFMSVKTGPGNSSRSHSADEYICFSEIEEGFKIYLKLLDNLIIK